MKTIVLAMVIDDIVSEVFVSVTYNSAQKHGSGEGIIDEPFGFGIGIRVRDV